MLLKLKHLNYTFERYHHNSKVKCLENYLENRLTYLSGEELLELAGL